MFRLLSVALGLFAALLPARLVGRTSGVLLWGPKLAAGALAPWIALAGALLAALGVRRRDPITAGAGLAAAVLAGRYTARVIEPHDGFDDAFGPGWQERIPPALENRMLQRRWTPVTIPPKIKRTPNIIYSSVPATGAPLRCDLWRPPATVQPTGLGVIYVHGGAWRMMNKDMFTRPMFRRLAGQGHTVMDIEYRLAPAATIPDMVRDVKQAILWLKRHAGEYGVDPDKIALMGGSAGGHLALMAAYTADDPLFQVDGKGISPDVRGVVGFYAPADLLAVYEDVEVVSQRLQQRKRIWPYGYMVETLLRLIGLLPGRTPVEEAGILVSDLVGVWPDEDRDRYVRMSPVGHVGPHCPPTLLLQGTDDIFGLAPSTWQLHRKLREAGARSILVEFPQTDHAFDLALPWTAPAAQAATWDVERFLALLLAESPTVSATPSQVDASTKRPAKVHA